MENMSEQINELAGALCDAQAEMPTVPFNAKNPFLKNKYADLGSITDVIKPVLAKHGLSYAQVGVSVVGGVGIQTILMHKSGQWVSGVNTLPVESAKGLSMAQATGAVITYLRRYALSATLGLVADEDTDGEPERQAKPQEKKVEVPTRPFEAQVLINMLKSTASTYPKDLDKNPGDVKILAAALKTILGGDENRKKFQTILFGADSLNNVSPQAIKATLEWTKAVDFDYLPSDIVIEEAYRILEMVSD